MGGVVRFSIHICARQQRNNGEEQRFGLVKGTNNRTVEEQKRNNKGSTKDQQRNNKETTRNNQKKKPETTRNNGKQRWSGLVWSMEQTKEQWKDNKGSTKEQ